MINYVINLDRRSDRWEEFVEKMRKSQEFSKETFIRISAFDGNKYEGEIKRYNLENKLVFNIIGSISSILGLTNDFTKFLINNSDANIKEIETKKHKIRLRSLNIESQNQEIIINKKIYNIHITF